MRAILVAIGLTVCGHASAPAAMITLTTGETLKGTIAARDDTSLTVDHPVLGMVVIPLSGTAMIVEQDQEGASTEDAAATGEGTVTASTDTVAAPVVVPEEDSSLSFWSTMFPNFNSKFELGLSGASGNTDTADGRLGFRTKRVNEKVRTKFSAIYMHSTSSGDTIRNQGNASITHDWLFPSTPWFLFLNGNYDFDEFRSWDHRVSGFGGFGYDLIKADTLEVTARIGGGLTKEFGADDDLRPEGLISGAVAKWAFTDSQSISGFATYYPDLSEFVEYRFLTGLEWLIAIDKADGLNLKFGIENEYESTATSNEKLNDLKYYGAMVVEF